MKRFLQKLLRVFLYGLGIYFLFCAGLWLGQDRLLFFPEPLGGRQPSDSGLGFENVWLHPDPAQPQQTVHGWYVPAGEGAGCVLFCHGNARNVAAHLDIVRTIHALGYASLSFDYRGYGNSSGVPSEEHMYQDAQAAWDWLRQRGYPSERILIQGRSLGGGVASWLAARNAPAALVLESTFTSLPAAAQAQFPVFPVRWLCRYNYDTIGRLSQIHCPVLFVLSAEDTLIPPAQGRALYAAYQGSAQKRLIELTGTHNDCYLTACQTYDAALRAFYGANLPPHIPAAAADTADTHALSRQP